MSLAKRRNWRRDTRFCPNYEAAAHKNRKNWLASKERNVGRNKEEDERKLNCKFQFVSRGKRQDVMGAQLKVGLNMVCIRVLQVRAIARRQTEAVDGAQLENDAQLRSD